MTAKKAAVAVEEKKGFERIELADAIDESLGDDDLWNDIVSENPVPALVIKGIRIPQPTKEQVDAWGKRAGEPESDRILMGDNVYEALQEAFSRLPLSAYRNFQRHFMGHFFGIEDAGELGK
jgi:hypothetical protein